MMVRLFDDNMMRERVLTVLVIGLALTAKVSERETPAASNACGRTSDTVRNTQYF
jgi:hypothetical protein